MCLRPTSNTLGHVGGERETAQRVGFGGRYAGGAGHVAAQMRSPRSRRWTAEAGSSNVEGARQACHSESKVSAIAGRARSFPARAYGWSKPYGDELFLKHPLHAGGATSTKSGAPTGLSPRLRTLRKPRRPNPLVLTWVRRLLLRFSLLHHAHVTPILGCERACTRYSISAQAGRARLIPID